MRHVGIALGLLLLASSASLDAQEEPQTTAIDQTASPIQITSYEAGYQERSQYSREGIRHSIEYRNVSDRSIRAVGFGLLSFSVFNDFIDRTRGIDMDSLDPDEDSDGAWVTSALSDFAFFNGVAYVSAVRFMDGEVWQADLDAIAEQVRKIQADFDAERLEGDPENGGN